MRSIPILAAALATASCRIETAAPGGGGGATSPLSPVGDVWIYTSLYHPVIDALDPILARALPEVHVRWYQAGSEKIANRLDAELAAGGSQADLLMTSDPFLYERLKRDGALLRYASANALRSPPTLVDLDGYSTVSRVSTMVLTFRADVAQPPKAFRELTDGKWKGQVAVGDPLTSGTAFTWALAVDRLYGPSFFRELRGNGAVVAGGNAAVLQRVESGESRVGVVLLENVLAARGGGNPIRFVYPSDGAVAIPGPVAILRSTRHAVAAKAVYDALLSPEAQQVMVGVGDMHGVDPRIAGPRGEPSLSELLRTAVPWDEAFLRSGVDRGPALKTAFAEAFQH